MVGRSSESGFSQARNNAVSIFSLAAASSIATPDRSRAHTRRAGFTRAGMPRAILFSVTRLASQRPIRGSSRFCGFLALRPHLETKRRFLRSTEVGLAGQRADSASVAMQNAGAVL